MLGHNYIGTEHLLLGLLDEDEGIGGRTLTGLGVTSQRVQEWLVPELARLLAERQRLAGEAGGAGGAGEAGGRASAAERAAHGRRREVGSASAGGCQPASEGFRFMPGGTIGSMRSSTSSSSARSRRPAGRRAGPWCAAR